MPDLPVIQPDESGDVPRCRAECPSATHAPCCAKCIDCEAGREQTEVGLVCQPRLLRAYAELRDYRTILELGGTIHPPSVSRVAHVGVSVTFPRVLTVGEQATVRRIVSGWRDEANREATNARPPWPMMQQRGSYLASMPSRTSRPACCNPLAHETLVASGLRWVPLHVWLWNLVVHGVPFGYLIQFGGQDICWEAWKYPELGSDDDHQRVATGTLAECARGLVEAVR